MISKSKRSTINTDNGDVSPKKKRKSEEKKKTTSDSAPVKAEPGKEFKKSSKQVVGNLKQKKPFTKIKPGTEKVQEKTDWNEFKKNKKELLLKRKQGRPLYDIAAEAKPLAELLRKKQLKGGKDERKQLVNKLHTLFKDGEHYAKLVFTHDMARVVQYLLKFGTEDIRKHISKELIPVSAEMLTSKYSCYCLKSMLKYGTSDVRMEAIKAMYGHAVKLVSHVVSASVFEYIYSTWAAPQQKLHLMQEFYGDIYKQSKDDGVKKLADVYKDDTTMKAAALSAVKANLSKVLNKDLLDSGLVQSVLYQYFNECSVDDKNELIEQLAPHVVILSNSRDGVRVVMQCIWYGNNKTKKVAMKALKEHVVELSKHEHGHGSVITLLDAVDDTVLVNKMITAQILANAEMLAGNEWGRKVLLWLVCPASSLYFHPVFVNELEAGRLTSTSKKSIDVRREEILKYSSCSLLKLIAANPEFWLSSASIAVATLAILKTGTNEDITEALESIGDVIVKSDWKLKENENEVLGIEHPGLHMTLKKLILHDKEVNRPVDSTLGKILLDKISKETLISWIELNRGCFLLVAIYENGKESMQKQIKEKLTPHLSLIKKQKTKGAEVLLKKLK